MKTFRDNHFFIPITLEPGASVPEYATEGASGADVRAWLPAGPVVIDPGRHAMIPTGIRMEIPPGYEVQVRPRSGLAAREGVTVLNSPGTIDSDYRGEVKVILINHGTTPFTISQGDRIAQLVAARTIRTDFRPHNELDDTRRGEGGFGSTGR